ncbi:MAG: protein-glutamate O-methyltransferase CheR [Pontiellaceae bacterium]|nr:protein-glutamate O-methyltransferase CheR [Pontiellaceae bacterium]
MNPITRQLADLSNNDFETIRDLVYTHCAINLTDDKKELVRSRLSRYLRQYNLSSYADYITMVKEDINGPLFTQFIDRISTNLTSFFRESRHFDYLKSVIVPARLAESRGSASIRLRGWSAACSTGEEPYTVAMTLSEAIPEDKRSDIKILASDISTAVLKKAAAGRYTEERVSTIPPDLRRKYFDLNKNKTAERFYTAKPELRRMVLFKQINLVQEWPPITKLDFIFCRNVFIYFDKITHQKIVDRFYQVLKPKGVLFIGHSESLSGIKHSFKGDGPAVYVKP